MNTQKDIKLTKTIVLKYTLECNLRCKYCYEFRRTNISEISYQRLDFAKIKEIFVKFAKIFPNSDILWMFHGGEPLLCGAKMFNELFDFVRNINLKFGVNFKFALQTNATLLNDEIIQILEKNSDLLSERIISISIDGPQEIHDSVRISKSNKGSFGSVIEALGKIKNSSLSFTTLSVVAKHNVQNATQMYDFIRDLNPNFAKFIPCYNLDECGNIVEYGISPMQYAQFCVEMFYKYSKDSQNFVKNKLAIDPLITIMSNIIGKKTNWCEYNAQKCDNFTTIFPNGELWLCDTFKQETMRNEAFLGNIFEISDEKIYEIFTKPSDFCLYKNLEKKLLKGCLNCEIFDICSGGCVGIREEFYQKSKKLFKEHCVAKKFLISHIKEAVNLALSS